jgi:hypothetical protein
VRSRLGLRPTRCDRVCSRLGLRPTRCDRVCSRLGLRPTRCDRFVFVAVSVMALQNV